MRHLGTQTLLTPRLVLRRNTVDDAPQMFSHWANDPEVTRYLTWQPHASVDQTRQILEGWVASYEQPDFYQWGIELRETGELIGNISMVDCDDPARSWPSAACAWRACGAPASTTMLASWWMWPATPCLPKTGTASSPDHGAQHPRHPVHLQVP